MVCLSVRPNCGKLQINDKAWEKVVFCHKVYSHLNIWPGSNEQSVLLILLCSVMPGSKFSTPKSDSTPLYYFIPIHRSNTPLHRIHSGERGGSVVECRTPEREVGGSKPTAAVLCPWARNFTPRKYWLITQEAVAPSRHDWKIVDWDVKPQHKQRIHSTEIFWATVIMQLSFIVATSQYLRTK